MGDRGNIFFVDHREGELLDGIYMYTHWSGSVLPGIVREALERGRGRWGDSQYLARIVFCELVKDAILEETGYGLGTFIGDNEHNIVRIDDVASRVSFHEPGKEAVVSDRGLASWSYEEYLAARSAEIERAFLGEPAAEPAADGEASEEPAKPKRAAKPKANGKGRAPGGAKPKRAAKAAAKPKANGKGGAAPAKAAAKPKPARRRGAR